MRPLTMGSLFDGIGGFPLASERYDIKPLWASEIEPFPMEVTKQRFPSMMHGGDITKLKGSELFPVDIVCGGSPCQDLSVAGARAGLAGARSGLFMEQIRIVKEMRQAEKERGRTGLDVRPRYMVWENVPGAFSSGEPKGEDFRIVLEEIVHVSCPSAYVNHWFSYFNPDQIFGLDVETEENADCLNLYANYDMERGRVCDTLEVYLVRGDGSELACEYRLTPEEQEALRPKMDSYCMEQMGHSLEAAREQYLAEEQSPDGQEPPQQTAPTLQM